MCYFIFPFVFFFFFQAEDGIRYWSVTGVQTCALPICKNETYGFPNTLFPVTSFPVSVGLGGGLLSPPLNQIGAMNEYFAVPNDFAFPPLVPSPDEVFSEIESFTLSVSSSAFALCGDQRVPGSPVSFDLL